MACKNLTCEQSSHRPSSVPTVQNTTAGIAPKKAKRVKEIRKVRSKRTFTLDTSSPMKSLGHRSIFNEANSLRTYNPEK